MKINERPHLIDGEFQSDKYPTTPRGKVPLSVKDKSAQDLLWQYAQRRRSVDSEFSDDLEAALKIAGYTPPDTEAFNLDEARKLADESELKALESFNYPQALYEANAMLRAACDAVESERHTVAKLRAILLPLIDDCDCERSRDHNWIGHGHEEGCGGNRVREALKVIAWREIEDGNR